MKLNVQSPAKKLRTQYKFRLMDTDAKRLGGRQNADTCGQGGIGKISRTSFMDGPKHSCNNGYIEGIQTI